MEQKIQKALKLYNLVLSPTGNPHADEVARRTLYEYMQKHNISIDALQGAIDVTVEYQFNDALLAELFLLISMKYAEGKNMGRKIKIWLNREVSKCRCIGPKNFWDEIVPFAAKYERKYIITKESVKKELEAPQAQVQIFGGSGSYITLNSSIISRPKFSEAGFFNAFVIKYELIPQSLIDDMARRKMSGEPEQKATHQSEVDQMYRMFHKESLNDQIDIVN